MTDKPENPPAFPHSFRELAPNTISFSTGGDIALRDYFAARFPMPIETFLKGVSKLEEKGMTGVLKQYSEAAYQYADAMLRVRSGHE